MGDLGLDTAVTAVDERHFTAKLSQEWEIWGPMGGYVASVALRAAGAVSPFHRPASFQCTYMGVAAFDTVELEVTELRMARTAAAHRVHMRQGDRPILEAMVWSVGDVEGLAHDVSEPPDVAGPDGLPSITELLTEEELAAGPNFPFWLNLDAKPLDFRRDWPPPGPLSPVWRGWHKFIPTATFDDPWIDACRSLILVDVQSWPSASRQHVEQPMRFIAPSLDLYVAFTDPQPQSEWLLCDGYSPLGADGLLHWNGRLWSADRRLVATGTGQMLCRKVPAPAPA
ncbi:MAG TPA: thioesterase family protein [Acidimicrobiales bacterium]|nr:thioesterase family protein [Acidimicrobiales bacterium]